MDILPTSGNTGGKVDLVATASDSEHPLCCAMACARWLPRIIPSGCLEEVKEIAKLALPLIIFQILAYLMFVVSSIFCGHLGNEELAAVTLATNVISVLGFSVGVGFCSAADTLLSQTFGCKNMKQIGVILQRSLIMLILLCLPCWALIINMENLLLLAKQDPRVARFAGDFALICVPVLMERFVYLLQSSFLKNQGIIVPQVIIGITGNIVNIILHYVFLFVLHLGVQGGALAINVAFISQLIMTFFYIWMKNLHVEIWGGWSLECLQNWHHLTKLAVPSILAVAFEWCMYDIGVLLAGLISVTEQGVNAIVFQVVAVFYMIPFSMGNAAGVRVGFALGAGNAEQAKRSSTVALLSTGVLIAIDITIIGGSRTVIGRIFTSDEEIISLTAYTLLVYALFHIFESIANTANGILKGMGKQKIVAVVYSIGYYVIGLPLVVTLMFVAKLGVPGMWYGMTVGGCVPAFVLTAYILRANWNTAKEEAEERTGMKQKKPASLIPTYTHSFSGEEDNQNRTISLESVPNGQLSDQLPVNDLSSPRDGTKSDFLPMKTLVLRRGLIVMAAVGLLVIGVFVRFWLVHQ